MRPSHTHTSVRRNDDNPEPHVGTHADAVARLADSGAVVTGTHGGNLLATHLYNSATGDTYQVTTWRCMCREPQPTTGDNA